MAQLSAQGPIVLHGATSEVHTEAKQKLGTRGVDTDGNIYVYVDFQAAITDGEWVSFDKNYAATQITNTSKGWVGVVRANVSASDRFGWVQIYGVAEGAWATSGSSAAGVPIVAATTDIGGISTEATTTASTAIYGVYLTESPDTSASSAGNGDGTSLYGTATVLLNFPFITGGSTGISS